MDIIIYSTPTCPHCILAKSYFDGKKVPYTNIDVAKDSEKAEEMIKLSGQMSVPVIKIDNQVLVGFDEKEIEKVLENK